MVTHILQATVPELNAMLDRATAFRADIEASSGETPVDLDEIDWWIADIQKQIAIHEGRYVWPDEQGNDGYIVNPG